MCHSQAYVKKNQGTVDAQSGGVRVFEVGSLYLKFSFHHYLKFAAIPKVKFA